ncbi:MAG: arginine--tRNA ligase [Paludibacteraceae bacterium]|nr:arginine--tRNA ligase [Paludibacteraceae bacterium]HOU26953.1 arginine--tRNA ligase [Paludibacteraceae bacterium]HPL94385.1 arginine--tRNA ligase [Paludibacteraceae bacterium]
MNLTQQVENFILQAIPQLYHQEIDISLVQIQKTKKDFDGELTVVTFPFVKLARKSPEAIGVELGEWLVANAPIIKSFNVIKGFLNLSINPRYWLQMLQMITQDPYYGSKLPKPDAPVMMIEYSSPNTNKPLHLGHIRNNLLGYSIAEIQKANGWNVVKTNIVNDRGIHICKSMLAWQKFGNGETPESSGMKGDHLVGKYYVIFDKEYKKQVADLLQQGMSEDEAKKKAPLMIEAQEMLRKWENDDVTVRQLWEMMNKWVYAGFDQTYKQLGVDFDKIYYESETYLEGKNKVEEGLSKGVFYKKEDGSVWADLTQDGLDEKLLLRADGTSVYMTQDIGTAKLRYDDYPIQKMVYVVGNEQNYHFQVLALLLDKVGFSWGKDLVHFSYGMVELPEGKMKSREGTVVDADDLMQEMVQTALDTANELGKLDGLSVDEVQSIANMVGLGALKYFILKVDPRKNMTFNPKESIDFNGNTGPFIQYTHARIQSVLRKAIDQGISISGEVQLQQDLAEKEISLLRLLADFPAVIEQAGNDFSPALIANYAYDLVKEYNQFYHDFSILKETNVAVRHFRLVLSREIARVIKSSMRLLGIDVPDRM